MEEVRGEAKQFIINLDVLHLTARSVSVSMLLTALENAKLEEPACFVWIAASSECFEILECPGPQTCVRSR